MTKSKFQQTLHEMFPHLLHNNNSESTRALGGVTERFVSGFRLLVGLHPLELAMSGMGAAAPIFIESGTHPRFDREPLFVDINGINVMGYH